MAKFKSGDRVHWKSHAGAAHRKVVRKITAPMEIKGHQVAASSDNPEYLVETDQGKRAAHKPESLSRSRH